jgi:hypothetical protein
MQKIDVMQLSKGKRQFLGQKGISAKEWSSMPAFVQKAWTSEMKNPKYITNKENINKKITLSGSLVPENHWQNILSK